MALFAPDELQSLQRRAVDAFVAARPTVKLPGKDLSFTRWNWGSPKSDVERYVRFELGHHLRESFDLSGDVVPDFVEAWMRHWSGSLMPDDAVAQHLANLLGRHRLRTVYDRAVARQDPWAAMNIHACLSSAFYNEAGELAYFKDHEFLTELYRSIDRVSSCPAELDTRQFEHWERSARFRVFCWSVRGPFRCVPGDDLSKNEQRLHHLLHSTADGRADDDAREVYNYLKAVWPLYKRAEGNDIAQADGHTLQLFKDLLAKAVKNGESGDDLLGRLSKPAVEGITMVETSSCVTSLIRLPAWTWDTFGSPDCNVLTRAFDQCAPRGEVMQDFDSLSREATHAGVGFLVALRGDVATANTILNSVIVAIKYLHTAVEKERTCGKLSMFSASVQLGWNIQHIPWILYRLGRSEDAAQMMAEIGWIWSTIDTKVDHFQSQDSEYRKRGSTTRSPWEVYSAEAVSWTLKLTYVLCTSWREVPLAEVIAALPSPDVLDAYVTKVGSQPLPAGYRHWFNSLPLIAAQVCEKLEQHDDALAYLQVLGIRRDTGADVDASTAAVARSEASKDAAIDMRPTTHAEGQSLLGRLLVAKGERVEAERAFERSVDMSHRCGLRLYEMLALSDLTRLILDSDGRRDDGVRRLKAVLAEMPAGPMVELSKLMGDGLDAEDILRS